MDVDIIRKFLFLFFLLMGTCARASLLESDNSQRVAFWLDIYTRYYTHQGVLHDSKYVERIYEVVEVKEGLAGRKAPRKVRDARKHWQEVLLSLDKKSKTPETWQKLDEDEKKVAAMFPESEGEDRFRQASKSRRIRFQLGQKDRFLAGLHDSGRYLPMMEEVFRKAEVPVEYTRLPFVESSFNLKARSKVGASGIWQFMRATGKRFLKINSSVDERNDPIRSTEAAAQLLRANFNSLQDWPLAVTAYNHGLHGVKRKLEKESAFGFASANFYAELLAAIEAEKNAEKYFGTFIRAKPPLLVEVSLPQSVKFPELCRLLRLDVQTMSELNPSLSSRVRKGGLFVPEGYQLRLPVDATLTPEAQKRVFLAGFEQLPKIYKQKQRKPASL